ncbi:putative phage abortive infection protein [Chryseobacterium sp. ON_d1]|uniref:putative phage abortive infection protein n=1 Tax=Chryseobacterium sp. ON_d1 TaxID=2583211 RepID=UPI00115A2E93|nr:putative phage abortive infection protein [Chryseobacterium sp. ON_d1]GEJ45806.1 hypothetical protein CRS_24140 [Chryseobacterium sp. ON_d1]
MKRDNWIFWTIGSGSILLMGVVLYLNYNYATSLSLNKQGIFGDMFGASNAFFTGLSFTGVIIAILLQRQELKLQRKELELTRKEMKLTRNEFETQNSTMRIQQFENTFFQMLNLLHTVINNSSLSNGSIDIKGKQIFDWVNENISGEVINFARPKYFPTPITDEAYRKMFEDNMLKINKDDICLIYKEVYNKHQHLLSHYFSTLLTIYKFIDENKISNKMLYFNIVNSQMSTSEHLVLFYHYTSFNDNLDLIILVKKYNILKNLNTDLLPIKNFAEWAI